jgi:hypothetical protein
LGRQDSISRAPRWTDLDQPLLSSKRKHHFKTHKWSWNEQKYGHGSRRGPKPRLIVLARANSKLLPYSSTSLHRFFVCILSFIASFHLNLMHSLPIDVCTCYHLNVPTNVNSLTGYFMLGLIWFVLQVYWVYDGMLKCNTNPPWHLAVADPQLTDRDFVKMNVRKNGPSWFPTYAHAADVNGIEYNVHYN